MISLACQNFFICLIYIKQVFFVAKGKALTLVIKEPPPPSMTCAHICQAFSAANVKFDLVINETNAAQIDYGSSIQRKMINTNLCSEKLNMIDPHYWEKYSPNFVWRLGDFYKVIYQWFLECYKMLFYTGFRFILLGIGKNMSYVIILEP